MTLSVPLDAPTPAPTPGTSGTYLFNPILAEVFDEAFERCLIDPAKITLRHIISARRSLQYLFIEWANQGIKQWAVERQQLLLAPGMDVYTLPVGTLDILHAVLRRSNYDVEMRAIGRFDYASIPNKTQRGRPDRYFVDRRLDPQQVYIWQTTSETTDLMIYYRFRQLQDVVSSSQSADAPWRYQEALAAGLAYKLSEKFAPAEFGKLKAEHDEKLANASLEDRERGVLTIQPEGY